MSHHANLLALFRSYCETFGLDASSLDEGDGRTAVRMEIDGVCVTLTQDDRSAPDTAYAFVDYGPCSERGDVAEAEMLATAMYFNLLLPAGARMRYSRHPSSQGLVLQLALETQRFDAYGLHSMLQGQVEAARNWRGTAE